MNLTSTLLLLLLVSISASAVLAEEVSDAFPVPQNIRSVLTKHCAECHGDKASEGGINLSRLTKTDLKERLDLLNKAQEQLHFGLMPPKDAPQPSPAERQVLIEWVRGELIKSNAPLIEDKLRYPDYGNAVDHDKLFSGEINEKPFTPARRWLVSPQIFTGRIIDIFRLKGEAHGKYMQWPGSTSLYGITNPFVLPDRSGIRDYAITPLDGGHLLVMLNNAQWMSHKQIRSARVKKGDFKADYFENRADRFSPPTPPTFEAILLNASKPSDDVLIAAIQAQFGIVLQRPANETEQARQANLPCWKCSAEYAENSGVWRDTNVPPLLVREIEKVLP